MFKEAQDFSIINSARRFRREWASLTLLSFVFLLVLGIYSYGMIQKEMEASLASELKTSLNANQIAIANWTRDQKRLVSSIANMPEINRNLIFLIRYAQSVNYSSEKILESAELQVLRQYLVPLVEKFEMIGFVVFDKKEMQVGALLDEPIGKSDLTKRSPFVKQSLKGKTVVSTPFVGEVPLPTLDGEVRENWPTMFASVPVIDSEGVVQGVLGFRIRPGVAFSKVLETSRVGETGEAFAFNEKGIMISDSRFNDQLREIGLLSGDPDERAILKISLRDRGYLKNGSESSSVSEEKLPWTLMAASALKGESGINVKGYNDYRGVPVVGGWTWLEDQGFGIAVEMDVSEAFASLDTLRTMILVLLIFVVIISVVALLLHFRNIQGQENKKEALVRLSASEKRIRSIVDGARDAIITISPNGIVESFNPAAEEMFLFEAEEILGKEITLVIPDELKESHRKGMERFRESGEGKFSQTMEFPAIRKNGERFEIELVLSQISLDDKQLIIGIIRDITERKKALREMDRLKRQGEMILTAAGDGIFGLDREGLTTFVNPEAARILGYSLEELLGTHQHNVIHHSRADGTPYPVEDCPIYSAMKTGRAHEDATEVFWRKDNTCFPVEYTSTPIIEKGEVVGAVVTFRDISERLKIEKDLKKYANDLEEINGELRNFSYVASHDLQEPLRKVMIFSDRLRGSLETSLDDRSKDYLDRMQSSVFRMQKLIDDLLAYSRLNSMEYSYEPARLEDEVSQAITALELVVEESGATIEVGELPTIEASRFQMRQLFQNLIGNALKFRKEAESPQIKISSAQETGGLWSVFVEDNGMGFDSKYHDRIFRPFQRLHNQSDIEGNGIGLAICQKIVASHHGQIIAKSEPGKGTCIVITLPEKQNNNTPAN